MKQNKLEKEWHEWLVTLFDLEWKSMCAFHSGRNPLVTVPILLPPFHALSTPEWSHSKQGELGVKQHKDLTSQSQREEVWIRYATLTQETSIRDRVASTYTQPLLQTDVVHQNANRSISIPFVYRGSFQANPHWQPKASIHLTWHEFFWCDIVNMVIIQHGKWPQLHLSNDTQSTTNVLTYIGRTAISLKKALKKNNLRNGLLL